MSIVPLLTKMLDPAPQRSDSEDSLEQREDYTDREKEILSAFTTNNSRSVFGLFGLPESVKGALFSRYSRSDKSLRRLLLDEFIDGVGIPEGGSSYILNAKKAEEFYDRVLIGYGDDSVAELGGAHIACEDVSNIASLAIEDSRIGLSPLEKSTRYVRFDNKKDGKYLYHREARIMASGFATLYEETLDLLFDTYSSLIEPTLAWVQSQNPIEEGVSLRAYKSATRAKTLDLLRGLLPLATVTNVGLFGNGRSFEYLLTKLAANQHPELQSLGSSMQQELDTLIPSFVKRAKSDRGVAYSHYLANTNRSTANICRSKHQKYAIPSATPTPTIGVKLVEFDELAFEKIVAAILYTKCDRPLAEVREIATKLSPTERQEIIATYLGDRQSRFHRPGRALEEVYYTFDIVADIGAYRDLHRHRIATQERQEFTPKLGYITPNELIAAGVADRYRHCLDVAADTWEAISQDFPESAQYCIPFAYLVRWRMKFNLREAIHLIELRSGRQGHSSYRTIALDMYDAISNVHPTLSSAFAFVDTDEYGLERLAAEQRLDAKRKERL
jgi:thymidylate synthase ThyX